MRVSTNISQASKAPPKGQPFLTIKEVAKRLRVTERHVLGLIEQGQLAALDCAGRPGNFPMPKAALQQLALRLKVTPEQLMEFARTFKPNGKQTRRALWRVPVESYTAFMDKRISTSTLTIYGSR